MFFRQNLVNFREGPTPMHPILAYKGNDIQAVFCTLYDLSDLLNRSVVDLAARALRSAAAPVLTHHQQSR